MNSKGLSKVHRFIWRETFHDFQIEDTLTGECKGMGDGVDMFAEEDGNSIPVSTPEFYKALNDMFKKDQYILQEAYFPETIGRIDNEIE